MNTSPLISIVIRTKNEEVWLKKVIDKFKNQTYKNIEIIIVDSGSTDKTLEIISSYKDIHLIQIKPDEFNYSYALNLGIKSAKGKYIGIFSGHSLPFCFDMLAKSIILLESDIKVAGVTGHYFSLPDDTITNQFFSYVGYLQKPSIEHCNKYMTNTNSLIRKDLWEVYNFDENLEDGCEDYDWACEMIARGYDIIKTKKLTVRHSHAHVQNSPTFKEQISGWQITMAKIDQKVRSQKK